jgi:glyoxylate utilization-related uncharacterized protein
MNAGPFEKWIKQTATPGYSATFVQGIVNLAGGSYRPMGNMSSSSSAQFLPGHPLNDTRSF